MKRDEKEARHLYYFFRFVLRHIALAWCNKKLSVRLSESITLFRLFLFFIVSLTLGL